MRIPALISVVIGLAVLVALVVMNGAVAIEAGIAAAGWGIAAVILMHLPQTLFSARGWRAVVAVPRRPSAAAMFGMRLIREAVNGLLPVAQIGGDIVGARLLVRSGVPLSAAGAVRDQYHRDKRANFPPDIERKAGVEYRFRV
jgi:hypothetical protein